MVFYHQQSLRHEYSGPVCPIDPNMSLNNSFLCIVNGELERFFGSERGLHQGCSLSPYLFVIAINVLTLLLNKATQQISSDFIMIFTDGAPSSPHAVATVFCQVAALLGLTINPVKSFIFMAGRISQQLKNEVQYMGIPSKFLPVRYMGLPLITKSMSRAEYEPLIDKIRRDSSLGRAMHYLMLVGSRQ